MELPEDIITYLFSYDSCFNSRATCKYFEMVISKNVLFKEKMLYLEETLRFTQKSIISIRYCNQLIKKRNTCIPKQIISVDPSNIDLEDFHIINDKYHEKVRPKCHACLKKNTNRCYYKAINGTLFCGIHKNNSKCYWI